MLRQVDRETVDLHGTVMLRAFIAEDEPAEFVAGVLGSPAPAEFPQMRELVRRGVRALPDLLNCLDDSRPTDLKIGGAGAFQFMFSEFGSEYDARLRKGTPIIKSLSNQQKQVALPYTVTVGDVCFALVGQITNRYLLPIRYQPTAELIVNSPAHTSKLAERTRKDWTGVTDQVLLASLLGDVESKNPDSCRGALTRLRFYFPSEYQKQKAGRLRSKIEAFEAEEKKR